MRKNIFLLTISLLLFQLVFAETIIKNYEYAQRDTCKLTMDVYSPANLKNSNTCIIFVFGGGFINGSKSDKGNVNYCKALADRGFIVSAIDYRLGLKGVQNVGVFNTKPMRNAINIAVEDLYSATNFLLQHANAFNINPETIIISGSSAGAVTVLQADYELANRTKIADVLPPNFRYAGVISFAGAVLSYDGQPSYQNKPAPTLMFHGTADKLVQYNKIQFFKKGFFGTNALVKRFEKFDYSFYAYRYRDRGHEIAVIPMKRNLNEIESFITDYVILGKQLKKDVTVKDNDLNNVKPLELLPKDLYKK